jgi:hypothetical protein
MNRCTQTLELINMDPSRFDELDVARCVAKLGGSMQGNRIAFPEASQLAAAYDVLTDRFGSGSFTSGDEAAIAIGS